MPNTYPKTSDDIVYAVRVRAKVASDDTNNIDAIKTFIQQRYLNICTETRWRWLRNDRDLKIEAPYTTGTVSVTNDSRTITGSGTSWTEAMVGAKIVINDGEIFEILSVSSATSLSISERYQGTTASSLAYSIYRDEYPLWPDFDQIENIWHDYSNMAGNGKVYPVSPDEMVVLKTSKPSSNGKAIYYTIDGVDTYNSVPIGQFIIGHDFIGGSTTKKLEIYPERPDSSYNIHVKYTYLVEPLDDGISEPLIPLNDRWVLVYGALSDYYDMAGDKTSAQYWNNEYEKGMRRMLRDLDDTDDKAKIVVPDRWRSNKRISPRRYDLGEYFDKYYTRRG